jgi:SAM-dependent methyltransferase
MNDKQDKLFLETEGDEWYVRNAGVLGSDEHVRRDPALRMLDQIPSYRPKRILEIGCSNGWRLARLRERYGCKTVGVEPSAKAVDDGNKRYPGVDLRRGVAMKLPIKEDEKFDLVIGGFVFMWVSRSAFLLSMAEVDRALEDGGHILLCDFLPDVPIRRRYHHLPEGQAYTYKQDVAQVFLASACYRHVARTTHHHARQIEDLFEMDVPSDERVVCDILQKRTLHVAIE